MIFPMKRHSYILITTMLFKLLIVTKEAEHVVIENLSKLRK